MRPSSGTMSSTLDRVCCGCIQTRRRRRVGLVRHGPAGGMRHHAPMTTRWLLKCLLTLLTAWLAGASQAAPALQVGSKRFTESYLLGEIVTQTFVAQGIAAEHRQGLGNTAIVAAALQQGQIDVYPEYTGT